MKLKHIRWPQLDSHTEQFSLRREPEHHPSSSDTSRNLPLHETDIQAVLMDLDTTCCLSLDRMNDSNHRNPLLNDCGTQDRGVDLLHTSDIDEDDLNNLTILCVKFHFDQ